MASTEPKATPLTASLLRAFTEAPASSVPAITKLFDLLAQGFAETLSVFNEVPARVTVEGISEASETTCEMEAVNVFLNSPRGRIVVFLLCDRATTLALCELSFGGTGAEPVFDGESRPLSKVEDRLRLLAMNDYAERLPNAFGEIFDSTFTITEPPPPDESKAKRFYVTGRFLVNAFGYSGEIKLVLDRKQLLALTEGLQAQNSTKSAKTGRPANAAMREQVGQTVLELEVSLPPEPVAFGEIGTLRAGQLIRLSATTSTPVAVTCEGVPLFSAVLARSDDQIAIKLSGQ